MDLNAMSENMNLSKSSRLRAEHKTLFDIVDRVKKQRNMISHKYGLYGVKLDWDGVWHK